MILSIIRASIVSGKAYALIMSYCSCFCADNPEYFQRTLVVTSINRAKQKMKSKDFIEQEKITRFEVGKGMGKELARLLI